MQEGKGEEGEGNQQGGKRYKDGGQPKCLDYIGESFWGKEQLSPWAGEFREEGRVCQPYSVTGRD